MPTGRSPTSTATSRCTPISTRLSLSPPRSSRSRPKHPSPSSWAGAARCLCTHQCTATRGWLGSAATSRSASPTSRARRCARASRPCPPGSGSLTSLTHAQVKALTLALIRTTSVYRSASRAPSHGSRDPYGFGVDAVPASSAEPTQTQTTRKKVAETTLELGKKGTKGVTAKGSWLGVEAGEAADFSPSFLIPVRAFSRFLTLRALLTDRNPCRRTPSPSRAAGTLRSPTRSRFRSADPSRQTSRSTFPSVSSTSSRLTHRPVMSVRRRCRSSLAVPSLAVGARTSCATRCVRRSSRQRRSTAWRASTRSASKTSTTAARPCDRRASHSRALRRWSRSAPTTCHGQSRSRSASDRLQQSTGGVARTRRTMSPPSAARSSSTEQSGGSSSTRYLFSASRQPSPRPRRGAARATASRACGQRHRTATCTRPRAPLRSRPTRATTAAASRRTSSRCLPSTSTRTSTLTASRASAFSSTTSTRCRTIPPPSTSITRRTSPSGSKSSTPHSTTRRHWSRRTTRTTSSTRSSSRTSARTRKTTRTGRLPVWHEPLPRRIALRRSPRARRRRSSATCPSRRPRRSRRHRRSVRVTSSPLRRPPRPSKPTSSSPSWTRMSMSLARRARFRDLPHRPPHPAVPARPALRRRRVRSLRC